MASQVSAETWEREVEIGDLSIKLVQADGMGIGGALWDSALVLIHYFSNTKQFPVGFWKDLRVCELGAGTGLCGLLCAKLGAQVAITDIQDHMKLITANVDINELSNQAIAQEYRWGSDPSALRPPFDIIIGSDLVYLEHTYDALVDSFVKLSDEKTVVYLAAEDRNTTEHKFFAKLHAKFNVDKVPLSKLDEQYRSDDITVYRFTIKPHVLAEEKAKSSASSSSASSSSLVSSSSPSSPSSELPDLEPSS